MDDVGEKKEQLKRYVLLSFFKCRGTNSGTTAGRQVMTGGKGLFPSKSMIIIRKGTPLDDCVDVFDCGFNSSKTMGSGFLATLKDSFEISRSWISLDVVDALVIAVGLSLQFMVGRINDDNELRKNWWEYGRLFRKEDRQMDCSMSDDKLTG